MQFKNILLVGLGGMAGSLLRYFIYLAAGNAAFPFATLLINITGSFVIGVVAAFAIRNPAFETYRLFLATGLCGGFTTFSAFSLECVGLLQQNRNIAALAYIACSILLGIAAAFGGYFLLTNKQIL